MAKVSEKKEKELKKETKKGKKSIVNNSDNSKNNIKTYEKCTCFIIGFIVILLFVSVLKNAVFIPAFLITIALELFCIAYYYMDDKEKKNFVYGLFIMGVVLVVFAIFYTIFNTI